MRVLILTNNDGGLYLFRKELLQTLVRAGHEVYAYFPYGIYTEGVKALHVHTANCTVLERRGRNPLQDLSLLTAYRHLLDKTKPDVVLTYTVKPNIYGGTACRRAGIPFLANVTGLGTALSDGGALARLTLSMYRQGLKGASCVFFQNEENRRFFVERNIVAGHHRLLPGSGVNLETYAATPYPDTADCRFLYVGRIMRDKGIMELLEAVCRLHEEDEAVTLDMVGAYDEPELQTAVEDAAAAGAVRYHPECADVRPYYETAHAVVLATYHEGMSNVLQEAAACARPVIATDIPGCREIVEEGVTGYLIAPKDAQALYIGLRRMTAHSPEARAEMGRAGREKMERDFDRQAVVRAYVEEMERVL